jgi:hypothetical protein
MPIFPADAPHTNAILALHEGVSRLFRPDGSVIDPEVASLYLAHDFPRELRRAEEAIADALPALTEADFVKACNGDHAVEGEVTRWRDGRWSLVDVSVLCTSDPTKRPGYNDPECGGYTDTDAWEILRGSRRFEVREVPRYEVRHEGGPGKLDAWIVWDNEDNEQYEPSDDEIREAFKIGEEDPETHPTPEPVGWNEQEARALVAVKDGGETCYVVWDTEDNRDARDYYGKGNGDRDALSNAGQEDYDPTDEDSATEACAAANVEDYRTNANGWPFAQNYAAAIDERDADDFAACGFVVATHEPSGQVYAGIDGGGYSTLDAHWCPLYLRFHLHGQYAPAHIYAPTKDGLRRVVKA